MSIFGVQQWVVIVNFLNNKAINLLEIINDNSPIISRDLWREVRTQKLMSESSFYRYVHFLVENKLIKKSESKTRNGGYTYIMNDFGRCYSRSIHKFMSKAKKTLRPY